MEMVGSVVSVCGRVTVVTEQGDTRDLHADEVLYAEDMLVAALGASATLRLRSGRKLELAPGTVAVLDSDVCDSGDDVDQGGARLCDVQMVLRMTQGAARGAVA